MHFGEALVKVYDNGLEVWCSFIIKITARTAVKPYHKHSTKLTFNALAEFIKESCYGLFLTVTIP